MKSGAIYGNAAMIDGMIDRMEEELAAKHPGRRFAIKIDRAYSD